MMVDLKKVQLAITVEGKPFELKRVLEDSSVHLVTGKELHILCSKGNSCFMAQMWAVQAQDMVHIATPELQGVLEEFEGVFQEPKG